MLMAEILYSQGLAQGLKNKVIVMTGTPRYAFHFRMNYQLCSVGGSQGIGAATVAQLHSLGSHVFFGDWDDAKGRTLEQSLSGEPSGGGSVHFQKLDVRDYNSQLALFDAAYDKHGRVDAAVSCAAVGEPGGWFEPEDLNLETVRKVCLVRLH